MNAVKPAIDKGFCLSILFGDEVTRGVGQGINQSQAAFDSHHIQRRIQTISRSSVRCNHRILDTVCSAQAGNGIHNMRVADAVYFDELFRIAGSRDATVMKEKSVGGIVGLDVDSGDADFPAGLIRWRIAYRDIATRRYERAINSPTL